MSDRLDTYLGDGVYASFDGYHIWLAVNDHTNTVVALEPAVFAALMRYKDRIAELQEEVVNADHD
jgi:hypothetical protein